MIERERKAASVDGDVIPTRGIPYLSSTSPRKQAYISYRSDMNGRQSEFQYERGKQIEEGLQVGK